VSFARLSIEDFCRRLGSAEPTPGGGAAAALLAKVGAALAQMVARHTLGRPRYAAVEGRMQAIVAEAEGVARRAGELMDEDAAAFLALSEAFKLPKTDPARDQAVDRACRRATEVPLEVMRLSARLAELGAELGRDGNQTLANDARAALLFARAAAEVSAGNVRANQPFLDDPAWAAEGLREAEDLLARIADLQQGSPE
jgi:formiminotetrahydrofolate cyclodeaminase